MIRELRYLAGDIIAVVEQLYGATVELNQKACSVASAVIALRAEELEYLTRIYPEDGSEDRA